VISSCDVDAVKPRKTLGDIVGFILLYFFVASWFVWGPFGLIFYVNGLFNSLAAFLLVPVLLLLIPAAALCLLVLTLRAALHWQELADGEKRWRVLRAGVPLAFLLSFGMGCAGLQPGGLEMFMRGFFGYAERRTDIAAIQNWLSTLDPDFCGKESGYAQARTLTAPEQPRAIASLGPKWASVQPDGNGRLMVHLTWGGGLIGHWGVAVGRADVPMPPPRFSECGRNWGTLAPGAYVWSSD
jgi:hypothetical protein